MGYEVDFLPVGDGSTSGDAIAFRVGDLTGNRNDQLVGIIDGGFTDDGKALVDHLLTYYDTAKVDVVVSTHPDSDHLNGLSIVVDELTVGELWIHQPNASEMVAALALDSLVEKSSTRKQRLSHLRASVQGVHDLISKARAKGIPVVEPFEGMTTPDGAFRVVGPSETYYDELVADFRSYQSAGGLLSKALDALRALVPESLWHETLGEDSETSPENNSSAIVMIDVDGDTLLFTGDAGADALHRAADHLDATRFDYSTLRFMQIPHHGSRRNVTPSVLDRFLGGKGQATSTKTAFVSCAPDGAPKHPAKKVTNAFVRRGCKVVKTAGNPIVHSSDGVTRPGWGPATPLPLYELVEE